MQFSQKSNPLGKQTTNWATMLIHYAFVRHIIVGRLFMLSFVLLLSRATICMGQPGHQNRLQGQAYRDSVVRVINEQVALLNADNPSPADVITTSYGHNEYWIIRDTGSGKDSLSCIKVWFYTAPNLQTEVYLAKNGELIYALQSIDYMPLGASLQSRWNCKIYLQAGRMVDMTSLGHGKTEDPEWDASALIEDYHKRKKQLEHLRL